MIPIARQRSSCSGVLTTRRAKISPFRQRIAAAVSTPSGAPPVPMTAWTPLPTTAAAMPGREVAVADQPDARAGRADLLDELLVSRPIEDDDDEILDVALEATCAIALRFSATVASRLTASLELGPTTSFSM